MGWERVLWVIGGLGIAVALWFTVGPWTLSTAGGTASCDGSPFMGRSGPLQTHLRRQQWRAVSKRQTGCTLPRSHGLSGWCSSF